MNPFIVYELGVKIADELMLVLGLMPGKDKRVYVELVMFGCFVCGKASYTFLGKNLSEDDFVSLLLLYRDEFSQESITSMSEISRSAFGEYQAFMEYWPAYKSHEYSAAAWQCIAKRIEKIGAIDFSESIKHRFILRIKFHFDVIEKIFLSDRNFYLKNEKCASNSPDKVVGTDVFKKKNISEESNFVKKVFPASVFLATLFGWLFSVVFQWIFG